MEHLKDCLRSPGWDLATLFCMVLFGAVVGVPTQSWLAAIVLALVVFGCALIIGPDPSGPDR